MKILILSCGTGGGHNDAAKGIYDECTKRGHEVHLMDKYLELASERTNRMVCNAYINCIKACPVIFKIIYKLGRVVSTLLYKMSIKSPIYLFNKGMAKHLQALLEKENFDAVIMTHIYPAETITAMKRKGINLPITYGVATDYTCIPFWEESDLDYYFVPDESSAKEFEKCGVPEEKIIPIGIPAPILFCNEDKKTVRERLGFYTDRKYILVMGGSMGAGKLPQFTYYLNEKLEKISEQVEVYAICGNNKRIYKKLKNKWKDNKRIHIVKYIENPYDYMNACDLIFTKPGGLTSTETALCRIPTVFLGAISGCEEKNKEFFVRKKMAAAPKKLKDIADCGIEIMLNDEAGETMIKAQSETITANPAVGIVSTMEGSKVREEWESLERFSLLSE